jgi:hypothetical protein
MKQGSDKRYPEEDEKGWSRRRQADAIVSKLGRILFLKQSRKFHTCNSKLFLKTRTSCINLKLCTQG